MAVLNLRGRFEYALLPRTRRFISSSAGVPSMISSSAMPATGEPIITRGVSPQAVTVDSPTASRRFQISGTSSMRIQWYWTFCRSVMSAVPRANSCEISPITRSCRVVSAPPSMRTRSMKYESSSSSGSRIAVLPPSIPGLRWV
ncbi:hypothetical protein SALBM217S_10518 [Streptomyces griseoloalbus]